MKKIDKKIQYLSIFAPVESSSLPERTNLVCLQLVLFCGLFLSNLNHRPKWIRIFSASTAQRCVNLCKILIFEMVKRQLSWHEFRSTSVFSVKKLLTVRMILCSTCHSYTQSQLLQLFRPKGEFPQFLPPPPPQVIMFSNFTIVSEFGYISFYIFVCITWDGILGHKVNKRSRVFCSVLFTLHPSGRF